MTKLDWRDEKPGSIYAETKREKYQVVDMSVCGSSGFAAFFRPAQRRARLPKDRGLGNLKTLDEAKARCDRLEHALRGARSMSDDDIRKVREEIRRCGSWRRCLKCQQRDCDCHEPIFERTKKDFFIVLDGRRIAKRKNRRWVSLVPGYEVADDATMDGITFPH